jgi:hypothetical protein
MNYNKEIPFEFIPQDMVYDVDESENPAPNLITTNISIQQLEGPRRDTQEEKN